MREYYLSQLVNLCLPGGVLGGLATEVITRLGLGLGLGLGFSQARTLTLTLAPTR